MKSVLDPQTRGELVARIKTLNRQSSRAWGKMTLLQMLKHCVLCEKHYFGDFEVKRSALGRLIGKMALKKILKDETLLSKNAPTNSTLILLNDEGEIESEKKNWIGLIERYTSLQDTSVTHWFFGEMTPDQIGRFVYKHADHHLRQFSA